MQKHDELFDLLLEEAKEEHQKLVSEFVNRDHDRTAILIAHLITERLLDGMIETMLPRPRVWLKDADYGAKVNLAYALGLLGDHEFACCSVLNRARNATVHDLAPLPNKWRVELERLTKKKNATEGWKGVQDGLDKTLRMLLATISHAWSHAKFNQNWKKLRDVHGDRWIALYVEKLKDAELKNLSVHDEKSFSYEVDLELAKEVQQRKNIDEKK